MGSSGLPWHQGEDLHWLDPRGFEQERFCSGEEALRDQRQGLDCRCPEGQEGFGCEGLRCNQEGLSSLQKGQGTLSVSVHRHAEASAQGVGMSTPFERRRFAWYDAAVSPIDE